MAGRILVIGSSCVDVILQLDHLPVTEEDMHPKSQRFRMGGCAYNAANILGKAGADVTFVTPVGMKGLFGPFVLRAVKAQPWEGRRKDLPVRARRGIYLFPGVDAGRHADAL